MFEAELHNKLPELNALEDYLTSCFFGALKCLPPEEGLIPVLRKAYNYQTNKSFQPPEGIDQVKYFFWPKFSGGEPDLVLILTAGRVKYLLCVEVKYYSPKSSIGEADQLKRYYDGLLKKRAEFTSENIANFKGKFLGLIYLTQYEAYDEIQESTKAIDKTNVLNPGLFHLCWEDTFRAVEELAKSKTQNKIANQIYSDLLQLLEHKNLQYFKEFSELPEELNAQELKRDPVFLFASFSGFSDLPAGLDLAQNTRFLEGKYEKN